MPRRNGHRREPGGGFKMHYNLVERNDEGERLNRCIVCKKTWWQRQENRFCSKACKDSYYNNDN